MTCKYVVKFTLQALTKTFYYIHTTKRICLYIADWTGEKKSVKIELKNRFQKSPQSNDNASPDHLPQRTKTLPIQK